MNKFLYTLLLSGVIFSQSASAMEDPSGMSGHVARKNAGLPEELTPEFIQSVIANKGIYENYEAKPNTSLSSFENSTLTDVEQFLTFNKPFAQAYYMPGSVQIKEEHGLEVSYALYYQTPDFFSSPTRIPNPNFGQPGEPAEIEVGCGGMMFGTRDLRFKVVFQKMQEEVKQVSSSPSVSIPSAPEEASSSVVSSKVSQNSSQEEQDIARLLKFFPDPEAFGKALGAYRKEFK